MRKEVGAESDICMKLQLESVKGINRPRFILLECFFFKDSKEGDALPLNLPWFLLPLNLILHIIKSHALDLLKFPCYFVKLQTKIVGLFAFQEHNESLLVASLAVQRKYRRLGIGTCILGYMETVARRMGKKWLEVDVLRKNIPAQQFYIKYGFAFAKDERMDHIVKGKKKL